MSLSIEYKTHAEYKYHNYITYTTIPESNIDCIFPSNSDILNNPFVVKTFSSKEEMKEAFNANKIKVSDLCVDTSDNKIYVLLNNDLIEVAHNENKYDDTNYKFIDKRRFKKRCNCINCNAILPKVNKGDWVKCEFCGTIQDSEDEIVQ